MIKGRKKGKTNRRNGAKALPVKKAAKPAKIFIYALAVAALGGGAYMVFDHYRRKRSLSLPESSDTIIINNNLPASYSPSKQMTHQTASGGSDAFPLKLGSRGSRVILLQQALDKILGIGSMQKLYGGIDGVFGKLTASALRKAGYSEVVDEKLFMLITGVSATPSEVNSSDAIATVLYRAAQSKLLDKVLTALSRIKTVGEYAEVNERYKQYGFISKTIVTDLLDYAFKNNSSAKDMIKKELLRIGLKVDAGGRWSLQGFNLFKDLIALRDSVVTDSSGNKIPIKRNTILGDEVEVSNGMTWFRSIDNTILRVPTQDVKYS